MKPTNFDKYLKEELKNPKFRKAYEKEQKRLHQLTTKREKPETSLNLPFAMSCPYCREVFLLHIEPKLTGSVPTITAIDKKIFKTQKSVKAQLIVELPATKKTKRWVKTCLNEIKTK